MHKKKKKKTETVVFRSFGFAYEVLCKISFFEFVLNFDILRPSE